MADSGKLMLYSMSMDEQQKTDEKPKNELKTENEGKPKDENADTELDDLLDSKLVQSSHEDPTATSVWAIMDAVTTTIWLWQPLSPDRLNLFFFLLTWEAFCGWKINWFRTDKWQYFEHMRQCVSMIRF